MKNCPNCGAQNMDADTFCKSCGTPLDTAAPIGGKKSTKRDVFVDQGEEIVSTIGSNYLQNFLNGGKVARGVGILTRKRFYYKGKNFTGSGKDLKSSTEEGVVSIDDITFSKFIYNRPTGLLVTAIILLLPVILLLPRAFMATAVVEGASEGGGGGIPFIYIFLPLLIACVVFFIRYFVSRRTLFVVYFPGGSFGFDIKYYPIADIRDFQRQLHLLKDQIKNA